MEGPEWQVSEAVRDGERKEVIMQCERLKESSDRKLNSRRIQIFKKGKP